MNPTAPGDAGAGELKILRRIEQLIAQKLEVGRVEDLQIVKFGCAAWIACRDQIVWNGR